MMLTCIFSLPAFAQVTVNLPAVKDNAIFSESVNNSSGAGMLFVGQTCTNNQRRTFMQFDPSSIPSGATINSVSLTVTSNNVSNGAAGGELFTIYGLQTNFGEGTSVPTGGSGAPAVAPDATWNANMFGTSLWTNPGGDFVPIPASTSNFPATTGAHVFPSTSILVSLMNSWINTPANNFGLMLAGQVSSTCTARRLDSRETGTAPFLTVTYTPCAATSGTDVQTACDSYTWSNGITYIADNNTAKDTLVNAAGCDSIVTLDLTILNSTSSTDVHTACTSFLWIDGTTYTASNTTATHTINNAAGCDSVITLNLTINDATTGTDVISSCGPISWIDGNTYSSSNNSATFTLNNANGCDSVVTLDFTLGGSFGITDVQTACDAYTWLDGTTYTSSNNTAIHTVTVPGGCDTVYTLNLTLNNSSTGTDVQTACDSYNWIDGNTYTASNTTATHTLTNAAGCDSVVTLNLTINNSSSSIDVQEACDSYTWIDGLTYTASNNSATVTLTNAAGCDSSYTLFDCYND